MKLLKPGDPCPCCGKPIKTRDPERLELINLYAQAVARYRTKEGAHDEAASARHHASPERTV